MDPTNGDPGWINPDANDYRPGPNSPLRDRLNNQLAPSDAVGSQRSTANSPAGDVGAFEN